MFPSPLEVNRFISKRGQYNKRENGKFPSPLEVNRFISLGKRLMKLTKLFPSPLEVNRFISNQGNTATLL